MKMKEITLYKLEDDAILPVAVDMLDEDGNYIFFAIFSHYKEIDLE